MSCNRKIRLALALAGTLLTQLVLAQPSRAQASDTIPGTASATLIAPQSIVRLENLRFGAFYSPTAPARMTIETDGTVTATGQIASTMNIVTSPDGRGPARFMVYGTPNRRFVPIAQNSVTISNGTSTMLVDQLRDNVNGNQRLNASGLFEYRIGGRLRVNANQAPGHYTGTFQITVLFL